MAEAKKSTAAKKKSVSAPKEKLLKKAEVVVETAPVGNSPEGKLEISEDKPVKAPAKAGKRSVKAQAEAIEKKAKEDRKAAAGTEKPVKPASKPPRSRLERAGKRFKEASKLVDKSKAYPLAEAVDLAVKTAKANFDASIEIHINLGVDPRQADQNIRGTVALPAGTGKTVKVAVLTDDTDAEKLFAKLDKEIIDFDVLIAAPAMMPKLGKYARLLGPRGLMPNPKSGTVTTDVKKAEEEAKAGRVEFRVDQAGIVHLSVGKASFGPAKLTDNTGAVLASIRSAKPASLKGVYIKSAYLSSTMGPSVRLEL